MTPYAYDKNFLLAAILLVCWIESPQKACPSKESSVSVTLLTAHPETRSDMTVKLDMAIFTDHPGKSSHPRFKGKSSL